MRISVKVLTPHMGRRLSCLIARQLRNMDRPPRLWFLAAAVVVAACATQRPATQTSSTPQKAAAATNAPPAEVTEASLRTNAGLGAFEPRGDLKNAEFDFDSARLTPEALTVLKANAEVIKANPGIDVLVAGNCDERGIAADNFALGLRRAKAVRHYYNRFGVRGKRIATISYGKETPLCTESTEKCWARNRRVETRARSKSGSAVAAVPTPTGH